MANRQRGCAAEETQLRSRRNAEGAEMRGLKRQTGGADGRNNAVGSRRNEEGAEMRGLKRQTGGADGRRNAVGRRRKAEGAEMRRAGLSGRQRATVSRRPPTAPTPLLSIIHLARALFPTAGAFSLCSPLRSLQWHNSSRARPLTATCAPSPTRPQLLLLAHHLPAVIPRSCSFCAQLRHAVYSSTRKVNG